MQWIYLSKKNSDEYISMLARSARVATTPLETWDYNQAPDCGVVLRGIMKEKIIKRCWTDGRRFRYVDSGYFGNRPWHENPNGFKHWHRIVTNDIQHNYMLDRPADRWERFGLTIPSWKKTGKNILLVAPDLKPCAFYNIELALWIEQTVAEIQQHTDRPVVVRRRTPGSIKLNRVPDLSFDEALKDAYAVVTFNSNGATESILSGVPAFVLAPTHAASPVASRDLSKIDTPFYPDQDLVFKWACHLAYGQFHNEEMENGWALQILDETEKMLGL